MPCFLFFAVIQRFLCISCRFSGIISDKFFILSTKYLFYRLYSERILSIIMLKQRSSAYQAAAVTKRQTAPSPVCLLIRIFLRYRNTCYQIHTAAFAAYNLSCTARAFTGQQTLSPQELLHNHSSVLDTGLLFRCSVRIARLERK